ncbi:hypothetical protein D3C87_351460 [compost metagenome]
MSNKDNDYEVTNNIDAMLDDDQGDSDESSRQEWENELEDDEPTRKPRVKSSSRNEIDDEDEVEEEEDEEDEEDESPASFLSTKNGKVCLAASAVMIGVLGFTGYTKLMPSAGPVDEPAGVIEEPVSMQVPVEVKQEPSPVEVKPIEEAKVSAPITETQQAVVGGGSETSLANNEVPAVTVAPDEQIEEVVSRVVTKALEAQKTELAGIVSDSLSSSVDSLRKAVTADQKSDAQVEDELRAKILKEQSEKLELAKAEQKKNEESARLKDEQSKEKARQDIIAKAKLGRAQVPGFQIINQTKDGKMSVVKSPSEQIHVYFVGEKMRIGGEGTKSVTSIVDDGRLMLIGDKFYVDETLLAPVARKQEPVKQKASTGERASQRNTTATNTSRNIKGWKLNGVFPDGFLIQTPQGEWLTVNVGQSVPGLGTVKGTDSSGNLSVGGSVIKKDSE